VTYRLRGPKVDHILLGVTAMRRTAVCGERLADDCPLHFVDRGSRFFQIPCRWLRQAGSGSSRRSAVWWSSAVPPSGHS